MAEIPPPDDSTPPRARSAEVVRETRKFVGLLAGLAPEQIMVLACAFSMTFICAVLGYTMWAERVERAQTARERQDAAATSIREQNAQNELLRQHCERESAALRAYFADREREHHRFDADRDERRARFEAEQNEKWRNTIQASVLEYQKWRMMLAELLKKPIDEESTTWLERRIPVG